MPVATVSTDLTQSLTAVFGFDHFRAHQREAVETALAGRDVLVVMPTGAGKSLCFQLPAAISEGVTLVISPLVALMRDQVMALRERTGFSELGCAYLNSLQTADEQRQVLDELRDGHIKLLYVAPERFRSTGFREALSQVPLARFVVDEAHCISEWGHDFRPDYLGLRDIVESLGNPPLMAVTATATRRVQESIIANLGMRSPEVLVGGFNRPNLHLAVHRCKNEAERDARLERALPKLCANGGSGLIYVSTRKQCEQVAALAARALAPQGRRADGYHAGMDPAWRNELQAAWINNEVQVLVATNAFGMGIDKPDVRFVIHYGIPESLESYYQESGRAGRDGRRSRCVILYHFSDQRTREWFIDNEAMEPDDVRRAHSLLCAQSGDEEYARIPRGWWTQALNWNELRVRLALRELEREGLVQRVAETGEETILRIVQRSFPSEATRRIRDDLEKQRSERYRRLNEMVAYCKTTSCRRVTLLGYFGDEDERETREYCCDNCDRPPTAVTLPATAMPAAREHVGMPVEIDGDNIHEILQGIDALPFRLGKARLNKLLRGAAAKDMQKFRDDKCPLYGALRGCSQQKVDAFLEELLNHGLLHQADEDDYFVCSITSAGREAWQLQSELTVASPLQRPPAAAAGGSRIEVSRGDLSGAEDDPLFQTLRDWRRAQAAEENLPAYCILPDRTLMEVAYRRPTTIDDLGGIKGFGPVKLEKYGAAVVEVVREST